MFQRNGNDSSTGLFYSNARTNLHALSLLSGQKFDCTLSPLLAQPKNCVFTVLVFWYPQARAVHLNGTIRTFLSILDSQEKSILKRSYTEKRNKIIFFRNFSMNFERKTITFVLAIITPSGNVKESDTFKMFLFFCRT